MPHETPNLKILIIDDHPAIRKGLKILLGTRQKLDCAEATTQEEALAILQDRTFDIALLDLTLHKRSGLALLPELEAKDIPALVYTMHEDPEIIDRAFKYGAQGYVSKHEDADVLFTAVEQVAGGKRYLSPYAAQCLEDGSVPDQKTEGMLSDREKQIFALVGKGFGNTEIAEKLGLSRRTVETYCDRIVSKLDFTSRSDLRKFAISVS